MRVDPRGRVFVYVSAVAAAVLGTVRGPIGACLWDSDTLASEAKGVPDVVLAITGRFDRNPPLYYEMRLDRAYDRVKADPDDLAAHDDAGVACDRLGRHDEAVEWMEKKRQRLDAIEARGGDVKEHRYRYLANYGTFLAHRWIHNGSDRAKLADITAARDAIGAAIALNPKAHFGREPYQLKILDWIINPPAWDQKAEYRLPTFVEFQPGKDDPHAAVEALRGLITLGSAWQSVDVFNALAVALSADDERTSVARLARWRCEELIRVGKGSMLPGAPKGDQLVSRLADPFIEPKDSEALKALYRTLRKEADAWHEGRTRYMIDRLEKGSHPDTDLHFWDGYVDAGPPSLGDEQSALLNGGPYKAVNGYASPDFFGWPSKLLLGTAGTSLVIAVVLRSPFQTLYGRKSKRGKGADPLDG